ncbi:hypothetical protein ACIL2W_000958 [Vibrio parahaemolyticus]|uniref:hypothetical protein n=1 Tax=Vibrio parahaemolyticus TaxID=670 RepID=UPI00193E99B9|nr:hypothetical protein [Vibrio parahaemolyticus]EJG0716558.1 hypothetical protein [Vibrio parahaemolyticus]MBM5028122.1 hypothetical protein [Vibrio parahaemolyticus]HCG5303032.1 hypothetical protein [Vibrio parahaemolyticus]HCG5307225.1 hypothetical protein [Vibrio parahaemolyticus]HCJ2788777.1 hypothetical protein [Vibrio parahaemolyticus]
MQILKIDSSGCASFSTNGSDWEPIDRIGKEHLLELLDICIEHEVQMDEYIDADIKNPAHNIIYKNVYQKLLDFISNKQGFLDEVEDLYRGALEKYN